jgi:sugar phosphate isomerase/epimerase
MSLEFGVCLYSVHTELQKDYLHTIEKVAEIGYKNVELLAGFTIDKRFGETIPVKVLKNKFKELGLNTISTHETIPQGYDLLAQDWDRILEYNSELGCERIVIPAVWAKGVADTLDAAEQLNKLGKRCKQFGEQLYLHTHALEFKEVDHHTLSDLLFDNTDPEYLKFEVDMAWAMRGGADPLSILKKLGSRCDIVHQKDISKNTNPVNLFELITDEDDELDIMQVYRKYVKPGDFVDLGEGIFDFETVYNSIKQMGHVKYTFAENEGKNADRFKSIENDYKVMKKYV